MTLTPRCRECGRRFDLLNEVDADEYANGHDCEAPTSTPHADALERLGGLGLPYATAIADEYGYRLVCPCCGFLAEPEPGRETEDAVTKSAAAAYALHFERQASAEDYVRSTR